ncbi:hypothetical protein DL98DRAFT_625909 [Cadophora sp. DSE1049]|nr:hypothetical protein DL98DRAFT_625909 [Cadophora sp. DSE1049]
MDSPGGPAQGAGACLFCRKRKLRCDRQVPRCQSCTRLRQDCSYANQRSAQHRSRTERTHVHELEERLSMDPWHGSQHQSNNYSGRVESLLQASLHEDDRTPALDPDQVDNGIDGTGCEVPPLRAVIIQDLEKIYFEVIYPIMPLLHYERYNSSQTLDNGSYPPLYLRYSVWAVAAIGAKDYYHQNGEYYTKARTLVEASAVTDPRSTQFNLCRAQTWLHLAMYDMMCGRFTLVWTNTCQAIRLLQIGKVHNLDTTSPYSRNQDSKSINWSEAEERRRAFWFAFCMDKSAFIGQGLPSLINEKDIRVNLPALDKAYQSSTERPSMTLSQAALGSSDALSPLSAAAVIYFLCSSTLTDLQNLDATSVQRLFATSDWMQRDSLCNSLRTVFCVPSYFTVTKENFDASLLHLNIITHCATIQVHQTVQKLARASASPQAARFMQESSGHCLRAASSIFELARLAAHSKLVNYHPASFFCIYSAMVVFADIFLVKRDPKLSGPITFLSEFLESQSGQSQIARILSRDFEAEYPSLNVEVNLENNQKSRAMDIEEPRLTLPRENMPSEPELVKDITSASLASENGEEWSSCATETMSYGLQNAMAWNDQVIEMDYASLFRDMFQLNPNPQHQSAGNLDNS